MQPYPCCFYSKFQDEFSISSIGLKLQFVINLNLLFVVNSNLDLYSARKKIELGTGLSASMYLEFSYMPFKNFSGGIIMLSLPILGLETTTMIAILSGGRTFLPGVSLITGGSITPLRGKNNLNDFDEDEIDILRGKRK